MAKPVGGMGNHTAQSIQGTKGRGEKTAAAVNRAASNIPSAITAESSKLVGRKMTFGEAWLNSWSDVIHSILSTFTPISPPTHTQESLNKLAQAYIDKANHIATDVERLAHMKRIDQLQHSFKPGSPIVSRLNEALQKLLLQIPSDEHAEELGLTVKQLEQKLQEIRQEITKKELVGKEIAKKLAEAQSNLDALSPEKSQYWGKKAYYESTLSDWKELAKTNNQSLSMLQDECAKIASEIKKLSPE